MSYFVPQPRIFRFYSGSLKDVVWPVKAVVRVRLLPEEVFGPSENTTPRQVVVQHTEPNVSFDANTGAWVLDDDIFLPGADFRSRVLAANISLEGNLLRASVNVASFRALSSLLQTVEHTIPAYLALQFGVYVGVKEIVGELGTNVSFRLELLRAYINLTVMSAENRQKQIQNAMIMLTPECAGMPRYLLACMYYRQALRLASPHEATNPLLNTSEVILNLAKCLEILFSNQRDVVRSKCAQLGYTTEQIESQIIPLLVMRSNLDVAHPVGARISPGDIDVLHLYALRALLNMQQLLLRLGGHLTDGNDVLEPLASDAADDRIKLCQKLREHLEKNPLPQA